MNSHPIPPISNFIKKKGENTREGTRPKPSEKKEKKRKTNKNRQKIRRDKITTTYGNLNRGNSHQSA